MGTDAALELTDSLVYTATGRHLSDLQRTILQQVWQGRKYLEIARRAGYTEGHVKDVASQLWQLLSHSLGEKVTKSNLKSALKRYLQQQGSRGGEVLGPDEGESARQLEMAGATRLPDFVGRQDAIIALDTLILQGHRAIVIQGEGGLGKTTLAQRYLENHPCDRVLELPMAKETADITPVERVVEEWLKQDFGVEPGRELGVTLGRLQRQLRQYRVGILIDNLEPALDAMGRFVSEHGRYRELLRVLTDSRHPTVTLITSRDRLCESGITVFHYRLPGLGVEAWQQFFQQRGMAVHAPTLEHMHHSYGGNAKAMDILWGVIQADFAGDMRTYWQSQGSYLLSAVDLQNLVDSQVQRLQTLDPDAYRVYCRLGVYRYQAVPTVPAEAIFHLMQDLPTAQHRSILSSLRNRSLLECQKDRYWLHSVVREDAIARLRASADWEVANRQAAHYWTESVQRLQSREDAMAALEAYYHAVAIEDYGFAGRIILHSRDNQWQQFLPLGSTLYRMGLVQPVMDAITTIIDHIPTGNSDASELYNILGDLHWIRGRIHDAISCQENAIQIAQYCLTSASQIKTTAAGDPQHRHYYLTMLAVDSRLSLGLYHLDLWDLSTSAAIFQQVIQTASHTAHHRWADKATVCLALVQAHLHQPARSQQLADSVTESVLVGSQTGRYAFFIQLLGQTYCQLGHLAWATDLFQAAIAAAQAGHYLQIQANALSGLGKVARLQHRWTTAITYHQQAITLLEELGAQCDLAEAHFQFAQTWQAQEDAMQAQHHQKIALQLFTEIDAPMQICKIQNLGFTHPGFSAL